MSNRKTTPDVLGAVLGGSQPEASAVMPPVQPLPLQPLPAEPAATPPQNWEYREVVFRDYRGWRTHAVNGAELGNWRDAPTLLEYLEQAGREGWELVSMGERHNNHKEAYFKRPKP